MPHLLISYGLTPVPSTFSNILQPSPIGITLPTVEEMIVSMKLATPTEGLITLSNQSNPDLFRYITLTLLPLNYLGIDALKYDDVHIYTVIYYVMVTIGD